jgi:hypothetical protein
MKTKMVVFRHETGYVFKTVWVINAPDCDVKTLQTALSSSAELFPSDTFTATVVPASLEVSKKKGAS